MAVDIEISIYDIGISTKSANILEAGLGVIYVDDLCKFDAALLLRLPNFGPSLLQQLRDRLNIYGKNLTGDVSVSQTIRQRPVRRIGFSAEIEAFGSED